MRDVNVNGKHCESEYEAKNENIRKEKRSSHEAFAASDNEPAVRDHGPGLVGDEVGDLMRRAVYVGAVERSISTSVSTERPSSTPTVMKAVPHTKRGVGAMRLTEVDDAMSGVLIWRVRVAPKADQPAPTVRNATAA